MKILYAGKELQNDECFMDNSIGHDSVLYLITPKRYEMQIFMKTPFGKTLTMDVKPLDQIKTVKLKIREQEGIPLYEIRILFNGNRLDGDRTFTHYNIEKGSLLHSIISVLIKIPDKTFLKLKVELTDTVEDIKNQIQDEKSILHDRMKLFFADDAEEMIDNDMMWEYNVREGSVFRLQVLSRSEKRSVLFFRHRSAQLTHSIQIYVKTMTGKTCTIGVEPSTTILNLKSNIQHTEGFAIDQQRLIYAGKVLEDYPMLQQYNIGNGSVIHMIYRMRGS